MSIPKFLVAGAIVLAAIGIAALIWKPAKAHVTVDTRPSGGAVLLADHYCPAAPCDFEVPPGEYKLEANLFNYQRVETTVDVSADKPIFKTIRLLPMAPTPEEAEGMHLMKLPAKPGDPVERARGKH